MSLQELKNYIKSTGADYLFVNMDIMPSLEEYIDFSNWLCDYSDSYEDLQEYYDSVNWKGLTTIWNVTYTDDNILAVDYDWESNDNPNYIDYTNYLVLDYSEILEKYFKHKEAEFLSEEEVETLLDVAENNEDKVHYIEELEEIRQVLEATIQDLEGDIGVYKGVIKRLEKQISDKDVIINYLEERNAKDL